jgi:uncharacterized protein
VTYETILGYIAALLIGLSLGLLGGGGSILTVPALVYLLHVDTVLATAYSLFIVGMTSFVGGIRKLQEGLVHIRVALLFGLPSVVAVYFTRRKLVPLVPTFHWGNVTIEPDYILMTLFAIFMLIASVSMIRSKTANVFKGDVLNAGTIDNYPRLIVQGLLTGFVTGLVGVGGGFLIIPALVIVSRLPMKQAIGTSLAIIAMNSIIGFFGGLKNIDVDWRFLATFSAISIFGVLLGNKLSHRVDSAKLKIAFGWFVLFMGIYIIAKEYILLRRG